MRVLQPVRGRRGHWPLVASRVAELVSVGSSEVVENGGATGACRKRQRESVSWKKRVTGLQRILSLTVGVLHRDNLLVVVQVVQERREDAPGGVQLVVTYKVGVVALEGVQDQGLVGLGDLEVGEAAAVSQVQLGHHRLHGQTRQLGVHLDVDGLVGLDTDNQLVAGNVLEDTRGNVLELDADFGLLLVEGWERELVLIIGNKCHEETYPFQPSE